MPLTVALIPAFQDNYIFFVRDATSGITAVIDPGDPDVVLSYMKQHNSTLDLIINTHHHADHTSGNHKLKEATKARLIAPKYETLRIPDADQYVEDGGEVRIGETTLEVWFTPGHTRGHICYIDRADPALFCGDTLFLMGCGRLFEGTAEEMWANMQRFRTLPSATKVYCAHEYTVNNAAFALSIDPENKALQDREKAVRELRASGRLTVPATLGDELETNPFLRCDDAAFVTRLGLRGAKPSEVFAHIRKLKDVF